MSINAGGSAESTLVPGAWLDRYELLAPVAQGGFGAVWLARLRGKRGFEKLVAIKVPRVTGGGDVSFQEMLMDEARIAASIDHDNVAKIIELGEQGDILYIVMEWIDGEPVSTLLRALDKEKIAFPLPLALRIISDMCSAAHAAHELRANDGKLLGVVHRDISPQNILITGAGTSKLIDFGIAKARDRASGDTTDGTLKGKVKYMAPEQALGKTIDRRADVFALGAVLYRFLAGRAPYECDNEVATVHRLAAGDAPDPLPENVPAPVAALIAKALEISPDKRFATAHEMAQAIAHAMSVLGMAVQPAEVASFVELHLQERLQKRRAAIDIALKQAADRTLSPDLFPPPVSSRDPHSGVSQSHSQSGASASVSVQTHGFTGPIEGSQVSRITGQSQIVPAAAPRWLWGVAIAVGALGCILIVAVLATRTSARPVAATPPPAASAAVADRSIPPPPPVDAIPVASAVPSVTASASAPAKTAVAAAPPHPPAGSPAAKPKTPTGPGKPKPVSSAPDFGY